jgi:hypothetical protein
MRDHEDLIGFGAALLNGVTWAAQTAMGLFVPIWAFAALGQELEGERHDLLALTRLSGWRVVWGKFQAALVLQLLLLCVALPFALSAFLFGEVDAVSVLVRLLHAFVRSAECVALALAVSSLARGRALRALLLAVLAFGLFWVQGPMAWIWLARAVTSGVVSGAMRMGLVGLLGTVLHGVAACGVLLAFAGGRLAHAEESRSTPLRIWTLFLCLSLLDPFLSARPAGATLGTLGTIPLFALVLAVLLLVTTEPEALPRAVRIRTGSSTAALLLRSPFLAGGGRGALFAFLILGAATVLWVLLIRLQGAATSALQIVLITFALPTVYVLLPAGLMAPLESLAWLPARRRTFLVALWAALWGCLAFAAMLGGGRNLGDNFLNPAFVARCFDHTGRCTEPLQALLLASLALLGVLVNLPRMVRGVREVLALRGRGASA